MERYTNTWRKNVRDFIAQYARREGTRFRRRSLLEYNSGSTRTGTGTRRGKPKVRAVVLGACLCGAGCDEGLGEQEGANGSLRPRLSPQICSATAEIAAISRYLKAIDEILQRIFGCGLREKMRTRPRITRD